MTIAVDPERHGAVIASVRLAASNIQAELDQLDEDTRLLRAQRCGEAPRAYGEAHGSGRRRWGRSGNFYRWPRPQRKLRVID